MRAQDAPKTNIMKTSLPSSLSPLRRPAALAGRLLLRRILAWRHRPTRPQVGDRLERPRREPVDLRSPRFPRLHALCPGHQAWPAASVSDWYDTESINGIGYLTSADGLTWSAGQTLTASTPTVPHPKRRPVVLFNEAWPKPYRLLLRQSGRRVAGAGAESSDGVSFENDQVALEGGRLGTFPDGHAVVYIPGRTTARPIRRRPVRSSCTSWSAAASLRHLAGWLHFTRPRTIRSRRA